MCSPLEGPSVYSSSTGLQLLTMQICELAKRAQVNLQSIRFYERKGLLRLPPRSAAGYRIYEQRDLEHVLFINWCQRLGFGLREVGELLPLRDCLMSKAEDLKKGPLPMSPARCVPTTLSWRSRR